MVKALSRLMEVMECRRLQNFICVLYYDTITIK